MYPTDVNSAIKQSAYVSISLACFAFVLWQSVQCIEKYIVNSQGTKLSLQHTSEIHRFPSLTICPYTVEKQYPYRPRPSQFNITHLKRCGLRYNNNFTTAKFFQTFTNSQKAFSEF